MDFSIGPLGLNGDEAEIAKDYARLGSTKTDIEFLQMTLKDEFNIGEGDFGIKKITTKAGSGYGMDRFGNMYNLKKASMVGGYTRLTSNGIHVHVSRSTTYSNKVNFRAISGHELIHAYHFNQFGLSTSMRYSEFVAYKFSFNTFLKGGAYTKAFDLMNKLISENLFWGEYPSNYSIPAGLTFY